MQASDAIADIRIPTTRLFIDGRWEDSDGPDRIDVFNPATGEAIASIASATDGDVDRAVNAADRAFRSRAWRRMRPLDRGRLLERLALLVEQHADELARLETLDNGKPLAAARAVDVRFTIDVLRYYAGCAARVTGEYITLSPFFDDGGVYRAYTSRQPVGVVAGVTPWNFPLGQAAQKLGPAIAFGCTIVLKPSEETSLTTLRLAELVDEAGFPPGAVNVVTGYGATTGNALVSHHLVRKIAFTGSTRTGQHLLAGAAQTMKRVTLELGGKSPTIILEDADLGRAIPGAAGAIFANSGQICTAGSRLFVAAKIYDQVIDGIVAAAKAMKLGSGFDADTALGPLISAKQRARVASLVEQRGEVPGEVLCGGALPDGPGFFYPPTVLSGVGYDAPVVREEVFGPVLVAQPFSHPDELPSLANDTPYGLGASIWTQDIDRAHLLAQEIDAGTVWLNTHNMLDSAVPFGGAKMSGVGREFGSEAILAYTETKAVCMRLHPSDKS